jgi:hypothetical protein
MRLKKQAKQFFLKGKNFMNYFNFQFIQPFNKNICYEVEKKQLLQQLQDLKKFNVYCCIYGTTDYNQTYFLSFLAETKIRTVEALKEIINKIAIMQN